MLGDFNADCSYVSAANRMVLQLWNDDQFEILINDDEDTTTSTSTDCAYDRSSRLLKNIFSITFLCGTYAY